MTAFPPGTRVTLDDPDFGTWQGRVVVCLCKRHTWQPCIQDRECRCGYPYRRDACRIPLHVIWDGITESHESPLSLKEA